MTEETTNDVTERALGIAQGLAGGEDCVVSHPDAGGPCGRPGTRLVWEIAFCEVHGAEAEAAAREELAEDVEMALQGFEDSEKARSASNSIVVRALEDAQVPASGGLRYKHTRDHEKALYLAYPLTEGRADQTVTSFDYETEYSGDGPVDWWADTRFLLCRFMREANSRGLPELVLELEPLRERASAQLVQSEDDYERRYVAPRRAAREAAAES